MKWVFEFLGALSPAHINFFTWAYRGKVVGEDSAGNRYYEGRTRAGYNHTRRWVMYEGTPDASKVPPEWHGWLHHQTDTVPEDSAPSFRRKWQKPHKPNLTGTSGAYRPPGAIKGKKRPKATGDYEAWRPPA